MGRAGLARPHGGTLSRESKLVAQLYALFVIAVVIAAVPEYAALNATPPPESIVSLPLFVTGPLNESIPDPVT